MTRKAMRARAMTPYEIMKLEQRPSSNKNSASRAAAERAAAAERDSSATETDEHPVTDHDDEIGIYLSVRSTDTFKVKKTDKVRKLKDVCNNEGFSENLLSLVFAQKRMSDDRTFGDYKIESGSTVSIVLNTNSEVSREIVVKIPTHPHLNTTVVANVDDTFHQVKLLILAKLRFQGNFHYELMYAGRFLKTYDTLKNCIAETKPEVYLIEVPQDAVSVIFMTPAGKLEFQVKRLQTIGEAKIIIGAMMGTGIEDGTIVYQGRELEDGKTFHYYYTIENTEFEYLLPFPVYVQPQGTDTRIKIEISPTDHVNELNHKVVQRMGLRPSIHSYFYNGKRLEVGLNIAAYGVREEAIIKMGPPGSF